MAHVSRDENDRHTWLDMAASNVRQAKDAETVMFQLPSWITHYNEVHPHKALGYRSPREFIAARGNP
jgi:transposase InsO family protein